MKDTVVSLLEEGYSPEQIKGRCNVEGFAMVSHETMYRWIWEDKRKDNQQHTIDVAVSDLPTGPFKPARKEGTPLITDDMTPDSHRTNISTMMAPISKMESLVVTVVVVCVPNTYTLMPMTPSVSFH